MPCPAGLFFKVTGEGTGYCDWKFNVECSGSGVRPKTTPTPTSNIPPTTGITRPITTIATQEKTTHK